MPKKELQQTRQNHNREIVVNRPEAQNIAAPQAQQHQDISRLAQQHQEGQDTAARQAGQPESLKEGRQPGEPGLKLPEISELVEGFGDHFEEKLSYRMRVLEQREGKTELNKKRLTCEGVKRRMKSEAQFRSENMAKLMKKYGNN